AGDLGLAAVAGRDLARVGPRLARDGPRRGPHIARGRRAEEPDDAVALADRGASRATAAVDLDDGAPLAVEHAHRADDLLVAAVDGELARRALGDSHARQDQLRGPGGAGAGAELGGARELDDDAIAAG